MLDHPSAPRIPGIWQDQKIWAGVQRAEEFVVGIHAETSLRSGPLQQRALDSF
jgi:hypothetical protein